MGRRDLFTGRSGQLALMSEFLIRGTNVAIPEVDVGEDIVVVRDDNDILFRVQVKTANAIPHASSANFSAQFNIPMRQLEGGPQNLIYAFVAAGICLPRGDDDVLALRRPCGQAARLCLVPGEFRRPVASGG